MAYNPKTIKNEKIYPAERYKIGILTNGSTTQSPIFRSAPVLLSGKELVNNKVVTWEQYFAQNPHKLHSRQGFGNKLYHIFVLKQNGDVEYRYQGQFAPPEGEEIPLSGFPAQATSNDATPRNQAKGIEALAGIAGAQTELLSEQLERLTKLLDDARLNMADMTRQLIEAERSHAEKVRLLIEEHQKALKAETDKIMKEAEEQFTKEKQAFMKEYAAENSQNGLGFLDSLLSNPFGMRLANMFLDKLTPGSPQPSTAALSGVTAPTKTKEQIREEITKQLAMQATSANGVQA